MLSTSSPSERDAVLYDGQTALAHAVRLHLTDSGLVIHAENAAPEALSFAELRLGDRGVAGRVTLRHAAKPGWRLVVAGGLPSAWLKQLRRAGRPTPRRLALWGGIAAAVAAGIGVLALHGDALTRALAPLVPRALTEPLGQELATTLGAERCTGAAGQQALEALARRLSPPGGLAEPVTIRVVSKSLVNAMALPGGQIVIFSRLIDEAESPDEVAGVLAHELGHVHHLHSNQALIRQMGVGLLLQSLGGNMGALADTSLMLGHSRAAEREADAFAARQLSRAGISTGGMTAFFSRHTGKAGKEAAAEKDGAEKGGAQKNGARGSSSLKTAMENLGTYASTHPAPKDRVQRLLQSGLPASKGKPALTAAQWQALRAICNTG